MDEDIKQNFEELKKIFGAAQTENRQRFDTIDKRFDGVDQRFDGVDQRFDKLEAKTQTIFDQVAANSETIAAIKLDVGEIRSELQNRVSYKEFSRIVTEK